MAKRITGNVGRATWNLKRFLALPAEHRPAVLRLRALDVPCTRHHAGFTLLEVMVALAVLAVGIVAALDTFGGSLRLTTKASKLTQAVIYAQNVMDHMLAQSMLEDGEERGEFPGGFTWRAQVSEVPPDDDNSRLQPTRPNQNEFFRLKQVDVGVFWNEGAGEQSFILHSLRTVTEQPQIQQP